jgi:hypothetical protein
MPERKNQHYVPQHFLKGWATDNVVNVLPLSEGEIFPNSIRKVCSRDYFYGNPPRVETELGKLEGHQHSPIKKLRNGADIGDLSGHEVKLLLSFITTQRSRTEAEREDIRSAEEFMRDAVKDDMDHDRYEGSVIWDSDLTEEEMEDTMVDASLLGTHHYIITQGIFGYTGIQDLEAVMLCNVTEREFIISDTPMVLDNPRYKPRYGAVPAGIGNRGLKIYCPIDQNRIVLLYDPQIYRFKSNSRRQVLIKDPDVVDQINLTQFHNAENAVISRSSSEDYIQGLHSRIDEVRRREEITMPLETESMETVEVEKTPAYQAPKISPDITGCTTMTHLRYYKRRPSCQAPKGQNLARRIFNEVGFPDAALIYAIRFFEEQLEL